MDGAEAPPELVGVLLRPPRGEAVLDAAELDHLVVEGLAEVLVKAVLGPQSRDGALVLLAADDPQVVLHVELGRFVVPRLELARGHRRLLPLRVRRMADLRAAAHLLARVRPVAAPSDGR